MGFTVPSPTSPHERARVLMARKDGIEAELDAQLSILTANNANMSTPLVDPDGFPRADLDIWAVRTARVRIIELRNDLKRAMDDIAAVLAEVYAVPPEGTTAAAPESRAAEDAELAPFARVDAIAPGSPAAAAGLQREDLVLMFGRLTKASFTTSLQPLAELVAANENRQLSIKVRRESEVLSLNFTPRKGWGGRGMLGCHLVPHPSP